MSKDETPAVRTVKRYVLNGPKGAGNTIPRKAVAFWLWWRTWAYAFVMIAIYSITLAYTSDPNSAGRGFLAGIVAAMISTGVLDQ